MDKGVSLSKYYKSFSGTDTIAFLMFPGISPITIGSLTTVSYSMYREKVPVINIGRTNINGITRGSRVYAGTMVFTLLNKHWVRELQDQAYYLKDFPTLKVDELPLFDIMIISSNEYGSSCSMFIYGIDFTDEAQTISVEDMFTENVFKFVAREVSVFDQNIITASEAKRTYYSISTGILKNFFNDEEKSSGATYNIKQEKEIRPLNRNLYLITNNAPQMGNDVAAVQQLLSLAMDRNDIPITYKYDRLTEEAVRDFQKTSGLIVNGVVDNNVYTKLLESVKGDGAKYVQIINKDGAPLRQSMGPDSSVTKLLPYLASVEVINKATSELEIYYQTKDGYLSAKDCYDYEDGKLDSYSFDQLELEDTGSQVTVLQNALKTLYNNFNGYEQGVFDNKTENYVKKFQRDNDIIATGKCDSITWNILLDKSEGNIKEYFLNHTEMTTTKEPGVYTISNTDSLNTFKNTISNHNTQQIKYSVISKYSNGETKTDAIIDTFNGTKTHSVDEFEEMFENDPENQKPTDVYYIVYPYGSIPYKWHFKIRG